MRLITEIIQYYNAFLDYCSLYHHPTCVPLWWLLSWINMFSHAWLHYHAYCFLPFSLTAEQVRSSFYVPWKYQSSRYAHNLRSFCAMKINSVANLCALHQYYIWFLQLLKLLIIMSQAAFQRPMATNGPALCRRICDCDGGIVIFALAYQFNINQTVSLSRAFIHCSLHRTICVGKVNKTHHVIQ